MNHLNGPFNWRATMGNADALPADTADYLDLITSLVEEDGSYNYTTAGRHTCAVDDPLTMLDHVRRTGLCRTLEDYQLYDRTVAAVRLHRSPFFCDAEIERRMKEADGDCPMCGFRLSFQSGPDSQGYLNIMTQCNHYFGFRVKAAEQDELLRSAHAWQGKTWPYAWMQARKFTNAAGVMIGDDEYDRSVPCAGCLEMEAIEKMEKAIFSLIASVAPGQFSKPGWGSPVSGYVCKWETTPECGSQAVPCNHTYMKVKRALHEACTGWGESSELRLNDAGLKLYVMPPRTDSYHHYKVTSGLIIGGDQVDDYPGFRAHAYRLFQEMGVPCITRSAQRA